MAGIDLREPIGNRLCPSHSLGRKITRFKTMRLWLQTRGVWLLVGDRRYQTDRVERSTTYLSFINPNIKPKIAPKINPPECAQ